MLKKILVALAIIALITTIIYRNTIVRVYNGYIATQQSKERAKLYHLQDGSQIEDISQKLIADVTIPTELKTHLINGERRIVIFKYLSGSEYVAGYYSYLTKGEHPVMIYLRGGNGYYGIMRPNNKFSFLKGFNVVATLYRGNIYGGEDEYGGADIQDVENLIKHFNVLEHFSHTKMQAPYTMMGASRGAMQMFTALSRSDTIKEKVNQAISVSGAVDLNLIMKKRPEMKYLFNSKFENSNAKSFEEWIKTRNPIDNASQLSKSLRVLLVYGLADNLVSLDEQKNFQKALDQSGIHSKLITIPDANHNMDDHQDELEHSINQFMN